MINQDIKAYNVLLMYLKAESPYDTGNLSKNGIRIVLKGDDIHIAIGGNLANYAVYTNEPWLSVKWNGKQNPNEGWIKKAITKALPTLKAIYKNEMTDDEIYQLMDETQKKYVRRKVYSKSRTGGLR
jgi:hypothetical protein